MATKFSGFAGFSRTALFAGVAALALPAVAHAQSETDAQATEGDLADALAPSHPRFRSA
mgnify:CR=1 FL=1